MNTKYIVCLRCLGGFEYITMHYCVRLIIPMTQPNSMPKFVCSQSKESITKGIGGRHV